MKTEPEDWRWANAEGVIRSIDEGQLVAALSHGQIAADALVWRRGWAEWMPAAVVHELARAVPEAERALAVVPRRDPERLYPPPLPAGLIKPRPVGNLSRPPAKPPLPPPRRPTPLGTMSPVRPAAVSPSRAPVPMSSVVTPMPLPRVSTMPGPEFKAPSSPPDPRAPIPTLVDMPDATATGTLRPPGAVPPPPRAVPPTPRNFEVLDELPELTPTAPQTPIPSGFESLRAHARLPSLHDSARQPSASPTPLPESVDPITEREAMRSFRNRPTEPPTRPRTPSKNPANAGAMHDLEGGARHERESQLPRRYSVALFALSIVAGLLAVTVVYLLLGRARTEHAQASAAYMPGAASAVVAAPLAPACRVMSAAERLSLSIIGGIPPYLAASSRAPRVAVGFAESPTAAAGMVFELPGLKTQRLFSRTVQEKLVGVVPVLDKNEFSFVVDLEQDGLRSARTLNAAPPFTLGHTDVGVARVAAGGAPELVWQSELAEPVTEMRAATLAGVGHAIAFRRAGQSGAVLFGWLTPDGKKKSELATVTAPGGLSGVPTLAQNGRSALLLYSWRPNTDVYWSVQLALAAPGALPEKAVQFSIPPGGPGAEAISPAASGLPDGRWLLQWTEGSSGARQVRAQVLNADLSPHGKAVTLSRPDQNAGQGALATHGEQALALYLVSRGRGHELWGASLKCP